MALPELTPEQRSAAAALALEARRKRADIKSRLAQGEISLAEVLRIAAEEPSIAKLRVVDLLESLPRIGPVRAKKIIRDLGIAPTRRIRGLGNKQQQALVSYFEEE